MQTVQSNQKSNENMLLQLCEAISMYQKFELRAGMKKAKDVASRVIFPLAVFFGVAGKTCLSHQSNLGLSFQQSYLWELTASAARLFTAQKIKQVLKCL